MVTGAGRSRRRVLAALVTAVAATAVAAGCAGEEKAPLADELDRYTDKGDGCQQAVSAIGYADGKLLVAGQERYQDFDDAVRSSIAAVAGTIALEVRDFPSGDVLEQARRVEELASRTAAADVTGARRVALLREYRREAMQLVIDCAAEVPSI